MNKIEESLELDDDDQDFEVEAIRDNDGIFKIFLVAECKS